MSELHQPSPDDLQLEALLRLAAPAAGGGSASDAAFEAGRLEAMAQQRQSLWLHRALTAAALVAAGGIGVQALTRTNHEPSQPALAERSTTGSVLEPRRKPGGPVAQHPVSDSPYSYLSLRIAVLGGRGFEAGEFELEPANEAAVAPTPAPSIADLLREQRGL